MKVNNNQRTNLGQMCHDIVKAAEIAGVSYNRGVIETVLEAYSDFFSRAPVTFVTNTRRQEKRKLSVRYVDLEVPHDPFQIALDKGLITPDGHPIYKLLAEIRSRFPMIGYGIDLDAWYGLVKIWPFVIPGPVKQVLGMTTLPRSVDDYASYFSRHHLDVFSLFALDFPSKSVNLYFMIKKPGQFTPGQISRMLEELKFEVPAPEILEYCSQATTIYPTFKWDVDGIQRLCFGVTAHDSSQVPTHLHPLLETYTRQVPILGEKRKFIYSITFEPGGYFVKIENDYTGTMIDLMECGAQSLPDTLPGLQEVKGSGSRNMEWEAAVNDLFEKLTAKVPEMFRAMVKPLLRETAEKRALERNSSYVSEADLVTALLDITPGQFKAESIDNLQSVGVDVQRYIDLKNIRDRHKLSWEQFGKAFHPGNIHFAMYVTDRCNQKCLHCAAGSGHCRPELSTGQWIDIVENIESSLQKQGRHGVYIWFGGEPTCRNDIRDIINYCGERNYFQAIITNGVLFDDNFARYCADHGMSHVFVSIDSADPGKSDLIRGASRSLEYAENAIKNALNYGLFVCCSTTVTKLNLHELDKIKELAERLGAAPYFRGVVKQKKAAENWDKIGMDREDYQKFYHFKYHHAVDAIRQGKAGGLPIYGIYEMTPFMEQPMNDTELTALEWGVGCQACRTMAGVDVNGDVFPCGYPSQLILGNALNDRFEDIMNSQLFKDIRDRKRNGKCASCHHLSLCGGGCRVHAESETGDFFASFSYCWHA